MNIGDMFQQSAILTLLGMGIVFAFLWLMIICVELLGKLVHRLGLDKDALPPVKPPPKAEPPQPQTAGGTISPELTAAITAAVLEYRKNAD
jgi:oxaloacetate decarboxylase gamma subunit